MKVRCEECNWIGDEEEILTAKNPFEETETITGCPKCKSVDSLRIACDEPGCVEFSSCGTLTKEGYRNTCYKHYQTLEK